MAVVVRRSYRTIVGAIVSTIGIFVAAVFSVRGTIASASVVTPEILSQVFEGAAEGNRQKTYAIGCYSQAAYYSQSTYYSQSSYQTTFSGNVKAAWTGGEEEGFSVVGHISKGSGTFVIDHPLDPFNKLLFHSFLESPEAKNIYDGIVALDGNGEATVMLPKYFEALNRDFRYQLKPLGAPMPSLYIKEEVAGNRFTVGGGVPNGRVSWQVTGVRHDPYILANPIRPEVKKGPKELVAIGEYIFPEGYTSRLFGSELFSSLWNATRNLFGGLFGR